MTLDGEARERNRLCELLLQAEGVLADCDESIYAQLTPPQFIELIAAVRADVSASRDPARIRDLQLAFAPTCSWDDTTNDVDLGNAIYEALEDLHGKPYQTSA